MNTREQDHRDITERINQILIEQSRAYDTEFTAVQLAHDIGTAPRYISSIFATHFGCSFSEYVIRLRIQKALDLLKEDETLTMEEIGSQCGFANRVSFYKHFNKYVGMTPKEYQNGAERVQIPAETPIPVGDITLRTLSCNFPKDTMWHQYDNSWRGYSPSKATIYILDSCI